MRGGPQGEPEAGDAGADDEEVEIPAFQ